MNMQLRLHTVVQNRGGNNLLTLKLLQSALEYFTGEELLVLSTAQHFTVTIIILLYAASYVHVSTFSQYYMLQPGNETSTGSM